MRGKDTAAPVTEPFERAIRRLEEGLARYREDTSDIQIRDGLIQRFEFTYELGHKVLKRYLEYVSASPEQFDEMTFQDLIRTANEQGLLLGDWSDWRRFREMRARTSHAYAEDAAILVVDAIPRFIEEAAYLRDKLRKRLA
ncbi:MAG: HI0074 family nucleotidyltransferase substrate-binding subunit [Gammaproteobacteria bacterium]|nr:HI0074 family nucleotidyltransferase substrate-binding subunit [Gammaproteobacteria bacterium]MCY4340768.1 HI0074 family nucleotidyltransferase substrate-binding subunit [Gammaproteobacteria bacterium]